MGLTIGLVISIGINLLFIIHVINTGYELRKYRKAVNCSTTTQKVKGIVKNKVKDGLYYTYIQIVGTARIISVNNYEIFMAYEIGEEIEMIKYTVIDRNTGNEIERYYDIEEINKEL